MRIFVISNGYPTKQSPQRGCFERDQAEALAALKHEVVMLSYDGRFRWFWRKLGVTTIRQNNIVSIDIFLLPNAVVKFFGIKAYQRFKHWQMDYVYKRAVKQFGRPDILYSHFLPNTSNAVFLKEKYGLPLVAMEHWSELAKETIRPFYFQMGKEAYPKVDKLLCVSPALSQRLNETFGVQSEIVPNIVEREFVYNPDISRYSIFTIVSVGSLIRRKRLDIAIEAFNTVRKKHVKTFKRKFKDSDSVKASNCWAESRKAKSQRYTSRATPSCSRLSWKPSVSSASRQWRVGCPLSQPNAEAPKVLSVPKTDCSAPLATPTPCPTHLTV